MRHEIDYLFPASCFLLLVSVLLAIPSSKTARATRRTMYRERPHLGLDLLNRSLCTSVESHLLWWGHSPLRGGRWKVEGRRNYLYRSLFSLPPSTFHLPPFDWHSENNTTPAPD